MAKDKVIELYKWHAELHRLTESDGKLLAKMTWREKTGGLGYALTYSGYIKSDFG
ncbi:MAG: hypothetical protein PF483_06420 [Halothiobacillus sp.]|nr:hypothetical protein [Halothiobacillus sp.]